MSKDDLEELAERVRKMAEEGELGSVGSVAGPRSGSVGWWKRRYERGEEVPEEIEEELRRICGDELEEPDPPE